MPLTWDARGCDVDFEDDWDNLLTQGVAIYTNIVGIQSITKKNWKETWKRIHIWERLHSTVLYKGDGLYHIQPEDVRRRISLRTNSKGMTKTGFRLWMADELYRHAEIDYKEIEAKS